MERSRLASVALVAMLGIGVAQALAHSTSHPTTIGFRHFTGYPGNALLSGLVESPNTNCVAGRTAKLIVTKPGGERVVVDTTRTSRNGAYGLHGSFNGDDEARVKVTRRNVGRPGHRHICRSVTALEYPYPP